MNGGGETRDERSKRGEGIGGADNDEDSSEKIKPRSLFKRIQNREIDLKEVFAIDDLDTHLETGQAQFFRLLIAVVSAQLTSINL